MPKDCCATCRFWRPEDDQDREPMRMDDGNYVYEDFQAPCGVMPPTEWLRHPDYLLVEPPHTSSTMWCRFHENLKQAEPLVEDTQSSDTQVSDLVEQVAEALSQADPWSGESVGNPFRFREQCDG